MTAGQDHEAGAQTGWMPGIAAAVRGAPRLLAPAQRLLAPGAEPAAEVTGAEDWNATALRRLILQKLPQTQIILVSNREPYVHSATADGTAFSVPSGGLVAALEPIARACHGTWIAHGSGSADRDTVDGRDRLRVPPDDPRYTLRRVWLSEEEVRGYYLGYANEALWPLCHNAFVRPVFRGEDWAHYVAVNRRFAEAVAAEAEGGAPLVIVQDYHFALLPRMVRDLMPKATIVAFWHIPWPNAEVFGICPNAAAILDGLLGADVVGFQVPLYRMNFAEGIDRTLESRTDREDWSVHYGGMISRLRTYPISIAWPAGRRPPAPAAPEGLAAPPGGKLVLAVGRLDYTKGMPECLRAVDLFLQTRPDWRGRLRFFCVAAPTRGGIAAYRDLRDTCLRLTAEINARHTVDGVAPIVFADRSFDRRELDLCYRAADVCMVPSLHDGMNLVAKEYVAQRSREDGVLILSKFAGAIHELPEALKVNPFDVGQTADALDFALAMPPDQQCERMQRMRENVRRNNIYRWADRLLCDAAHFRGRNRIAAFDAPPGGDRPEPLPDAEEGRDAPATRSRS